MKKRELPWGYHEWRQNNPYSGKNFSILGDFTSLLKDGSLEVWWKQVIDYFGGELLVNNSVPESLVTKLQGSAGLYPSGCSDERTNGLHSGDTLPDVIVVYMGTNDLMCSIPIRPKRAGFYDEKTNTFVDGYVGCQDENVIFSTAYTSMIDKLHKNYPHAEIWCCTINKSLIKLKPDFVRIASYGKTNIEEMNDIIEEIAIRENCKLIDLNDFKAPHKIMPNGHRRSQNKPSTLAEFTIKCMADEMGAAFLIPEREVLEDGVMKRRERSVMLYPDILVLMFEGNEYQVHINKRCVLVGNERADNDFWVDSERVGWQHAEFLYEDDKWYIRDLHSEHGTWLNGKQMEPDVKYLLYKEDEIDFAHEKKVYFFKEF